MKKMLGFLGKCKDVLFKYKYLIIVGLVLIIFAGGISWGITALIPDRGVSIYGNRLDGIAEFDVSTEKFPQLEEKLMEEEFVNDVGITMSGRIINIKIEVFQGTDPVVAKAVTDDILTFFSEEVQDFFDMQIFLVEEVIDDEDDDEEDDDEEVAETEKVYPKIGYKQRGSLRFVWTN